MAHGLNGRFSCLMLSPVRDGVYELPSILSTVSPHEGWTQDPSQYFWTMKVLIMKDPCGVFQQCILTVAHVAYGSGSVRFCLVCLTAARKKPGSFSVIPLASMMLFPKGPDP